MNHFSTPFTSETASVSAFGRTATGSLRVRFSSLFNACNPLMSRQCRLWVRFCSVFLVWALLFADSASGQGTILGNYSSTNDQKALNKLAASTLGIAVRFTVGSKDIKVSGLKLRLGLAMDDFTIEISRDGLYGDQYGNTYATFNNPTLNDAIDDYIFTPKASTILKANTSYWIRFTRYSPTSTAKWLGNNPAIEPTSPDNSLAVSTCIVSENGSVFANTTDYPSFELLGCPVVTPSVSISASPSNKVTSGTDVTFNATPTNGGTTPQYKWYKNDVEYTGTTSLVNGDKIYAVMTSSDPCASPTTATSNTITMEIVTSSLTLGSPTNPTTCGGTDGSIAFRSTGITTGNQTLNYKKDGEATSKEVNLFPNGSFVLSGLGKGVYSDFAIGTTTATGSRELTDLPSISSAFYESNPTTCGGSDGSIRLRTSVLEGTTVSVTFKKDGELQTKSGIKVQKVPEILVPTPFPGYIIPGYNYIDIPNLSAGTYTDFSISLNSNIVSSCSSNTITTSTKLSDPNAPTISAGMAVNPTTCGGTGSIPFTSTNLSNGKYSLSFTATGAGATTSPQDVMVSGNAFSLTGLKKGTYSNFSIAISPACSASDAASKTLNDPDLPTPSITGLNTAYCKDAAAVTLTGNPMGGSFKIDGNAATQFDPSVLSAGSRSVVYTYTDGKGCTNTATQNVTVNALPTVKIEGASTLCIGSTTTLSPTTGGIWASTNPAVATVTDAGVVTGQKAGQARFLFTDASTGCNALTNPVFVNPTPTVAATNKEQNICSGDAIRPMVCSPAESSLEGGGSSTLGASIGGTTEYIWTRDKTAEVTGMPSNGSANSANSNTISGSLTNTTNAPITVTFTITPRFTQNNVSCDGTPITATVVVKPASSVSITGATTICIGSTTTLSPTTGGTWASSDNTIATVTNAGVVTGVKNGTATFRFTQTSTGCTSAATSAILVNPTPTVAATNRTQTLCSGDAIRPIVCSPTVGDLVDNGSGTLANVNNAATRVYNWTRDKATEVTGMAASGTANASNSNTISGSLTNTTNDPVTVTFTITPRYTQNNVSCDGTPITATVVVNPTLIPSVSITANPSGIIFSGTNVTFTATPVNGGTTPTYQWKKNGNNVSTNSPTYADATLVNNDVITCEMTSNATCASPTTVVSNAIRITLATLPYISCANPSVVSPTGNVPPSNPTIVATIPSKISYTDKSFDIPCGTNAIPTGFPGDASYSFALAAQSERVIVRSYVADFGGGFLSTCSQAFFVPKADCAQTIKPQDVTAICINGVPHIKPEDTSNGTTLIKGTGYPQSNFGTAITEGSAGLSSSYSDGAVSNGRFTRTWTIKDKCGVNCASFTQIITIPTCAIPQIAISGDIKRETGEAVAATVKVFNSQEEVSTTQGSFYNFPTLPTGQNYRIRPERTHDVYNGVTTYDIAMISRHILDIDNFKSPYQMIAADVNRDGQIDALDMVYLRNLILRRVTQFPSNQAWRFIPKNYVFKNPSSPFSEDFPEILFYNNVRDNINKADFVAIKLGDVNLTAQTNVNPIQVRNIPEVAYVQVEDMRLEQGREYRIPVKIQGHSITALQFALNLDKTAVESFHLENGDIPQFGEGNYNIVADKGIIATAWANSKAASDNTIFTLVVKVKKAISISDLLKMNVDFTANLAYNTEGVEKQVQLQFGSDKKVNPAFDLHQNRPNPFSTETTISFILPESNNAELSIYDINGRIIHSVKQGFNKGYNEVILKSDMIKTSGIYFYRLTSDKFSAVKRMQFVH